MKIHQQVDVTVLARGNDNIIILLDEVILADNIVHPYPSIHLVIGEGERGYVMKR
jgi:hypothetical protein